MKLFGKRALTLVTAAAIMATSITGCSSKVDDSDVVATVDGKDITLGVANFYARMQQAEYETYYASYLGGDEMWNSPADEDKTYEESVKESVLESIENMYLLEAHQDDYKVSLTDEEKEEIKDVASEFYENNGAKEKEAVSGTKENAERVLTLITIQDKMRKEIIKDTDREVSDEEAAQKAMQYVAFKFTSQDDQGNQTQLSEDEIKQLKKDAEAFQKDAASAEDFNAYGSEKGYDVLNFTFDSESETPNADLIKAADKLKEGEVTEVIEAEDACYVAKVTSLLDRDATDQKKETIISEREGEVYQDKIKEFRKAADIKEFKNVWKSVSFDKLGVTLKQEEPEEGAEDGTTTEDTTGTDTTGEDTGTEEGTETETPSEENGDNTANEETPAE